MSRTAALLALALSACLAGPALAAPPRIVGFDDMSCAAWSKSKAEPELRNNYVAWIRGVLTGHNYARPSQQVSAMSSGTIENFVDQYCREKPQGDFGEAALRMSDRFSGRNEAIS